MLCSLLLELLNVELEVLDVFPVADSAVDPLHVWLDHILALVLDLWVGWVDLNGGGLSLLKSDLEVLVKVILPGLEFIVFKASVDEHVLEHLVEVGVHLEHLALQVCFESSV